MMGCTALHWVTCNGHTAAKKQKQYTSIAELLFKHGADVTIQDNGDKTPIELTLLPCPVVRRPCASRIQLTWHSVQRHANDDSEAQKDHSE
eukprot:758184-Hanusia_phi.AAC.4